MATKSSSSSKNTFTPNKSLQSPVPQQSNQSLVNQSSINPFTNKPITPTLRTGGSGSSSPQSLVDQSTVAPNGEPIVPQVNSAPSPLPTQSMQTALAPNFIALQTTLTKPFITSPSLYQRDIFMKQQSQQLKENKIKTSISNAEEKVISKLFPSSAQDIIAQKNFERLENQITNFNNKYSDKKLTQEEYEQAVIEQSQINSKIKVFEKSEEGRAKLRKSDPVGQFLTGAGVGLVSAPFELASFSVGIVTEPIQTFKDVGKSFKELPATFLENPAYTSGYLVGSLAGQELLLKAGGKIIRKGVDIYRTRDLIELPMEDIVAPEYLAGEKFPSIKKGQTAGELLEEFKTKYPETYGVSALKGFTASPNPLPANTEALAGSSELSGLYQAPKLSPAFLRITKAEKSAFSLLGDSWRPTIVKVNPEDFELAPYLKSSQKNLSPLSPAERFFGSPRKNIPVGNAKRGTSYVPFIKTEKEAVLTAGTKLAKSGRRFFIKFEGRRIPIDEFDTIATDDLGNVIQRLPKKVKEVSLKEIKESLSSSKLGRRGIIESSEIIGIGSSIKSSISKPSNANNFIKSSEPYSNLSLSSVPSSIFSRSSSLMSSTSSISSVSSPSSISSLTSIPSSVLSPLSSLGSGSSSLIPPVPSIPSSPKSPPRRNTSSLRNSREEPERSYDVFIKPPKRKNYVKVTKSPVEFQKAKDIRNFFTDQTTSRQGFIRARTSRPSPSTYKIPESYSDMTNYKFRKFKQKRGRRINLEPERVIEKSKYLIDTSNEKKELDIFKAMAKYKVKGDSKSNKPVGLTFT